MLPNVLAGSYQRYKTDTATFTTWLSNAAMACGYEASDRSGPETSTGPKKNRPKEKARKKAREASEKEELPVKHTITTKDHLQQAHIIAGKVEVPETLQKILERAIQARQRCAEWFRTSKADDHFSNEGHQQFIGVLKQTLKIIGRQKGDDETGKGEEYSDDSLGEASWHELANRFQNLAVEEIPEFEGPDLSQDGLNSTYELEEESEEMKMSLMIFCFFEDMHRLQDFIHDTWRSYKANELDLITASLITNSAVDIVRQNEEQILATAPKLFSTKHSYSTIAMVIFSEDALSQGQDPAAKLKSVESLRPTPFDDFIYLSTARALMKFDYVCMEPPPSRAWCIISSAEEDATLPQLMMDAQLFDDYCEVQTKLCLLIKGPEYAPYPWRYPAPAEDELNSGLRKLRKEGVLSVWLVFAARVFLDVIDILGTDLHRDHMNVPPARLSIYGSDGPERSRIHRNIIQNRINVKTTVYNFVAGRRVRSCGKVGPSAHILGSWYRDSDFCRIQGHIVQKLGLSDPDWGKMKAYKGLDDFLSRNKSAKPGTVRAYHAHTSEPEFIVKMRESAKGTEIKDMTLKDLSFATIGSTEFIIPSAQSEEENRTASRKRTRPSKKYRKIDVRTIKPHEDPEYLMGHNPVYCGLWSLYLVVGNEQAGIQLGNYHIVITLVAHLYSEARRSGMLDMRWAEMDEMIDLHLDVVFDGRLPKSAHEAYTRYQKLMCLSTTSRQNILERDLPYKEPQCKPVPFAKTVGPFLRRETDSHSCLGQIESLIQSNRELIQYESKHKRRSARRKLTPLELLIQIKEFLPSQIPKMQFDYITLTKTCYTIIKTLRLDIYKTLGIKHQIYHEEGLIQCYFPMMVLHILKEGGDLQNVTRSRQEALPQSQQMEVVAKVLKRYLEIKKHVAASTRRA
ncbi:hypothetical protein LSUE1_G002898 [Lachnellula suecica]|uniref:DUF6604 domain-containing protein n=1 Tax=Lachnellula suecica TaxID=602035 RepID=A0A8T9C946_9HELO|nr:hypothetical protein LSUE1_G002898 [Lachnellula suecica]